MFVMHLLIPETDLAKPAIESAPGPELPKQIQPLVGERISRGGRFVPACGLSITPPAQRPSPQDPGFFDGVVHRGTDASYAGVSCRKCLESEGMKKYAQPHPRDIKPHDEAVADLGCC